MSNNKMLLMIQKLAGKTSTSELPTVSKLKDRLSEATQKSTPGSRLARYREVQRTTKDLKEDSGVYFKDFEQYVKERDDYIESLNEWTDETKREKERKEFEESYDKLIKSTEMLDESYLRKYGRRNEDIEQFKKSIESENKGLITTEQQTQSAYDTYESEVAGELDKYSLKERYMAGDPRVIFREDYGTQSFFVDTGERVNGEVVYQQGGTSNKYIGAPKHTAQYYGFGSENWFSKGISGNKITEPYLIHKKGFSEVGLKTLGDFAPTKVSLTKQYDFTKLSPKTVPGKAVLLKDSWKPQKQKSIIAVNPFTNKVY